MLIPSELRFFPSQGPAVGPGFIAGIPQIGHHFVPDVCLSWNRLAALLNLSTSNCLHPRKTTSFGCRLKRSTRRSWTATEVKGGLTICTVQLRVCGPLAWNGR